MGFKLKIKYHFTTTQLIVFGFLALVMAGTILLMLPVSNVTGHPTPLINAFFTATSAVCVTGLTVVDTYAYWSLFGKCVLLLLIQCGGLGMVAIITGVMLLLGKKVSLRERLLLEDSFNLQSLSGVIKFLMKILKGTFCVEAAGAVAYALVFIPEYGLLKGAAYGIFHSISAFCNAGMDILGPDSFQRYAGMPWLNIVTMSLIILGGLGFIVWWDILRVAGMVRKKAVTCRQFFHKLTLHSKIVLCMTGVLVLGGALLFFVLEYHNNKTIGTFSFGKKLLASLFQSVTTRTAGFCTVPQDGLTDGSVLICIIWMFIGGSSVGTAGGIKTTTAAIIFFLALSTIRGEEGVQVFGRRIPTHTVKKAISVAFISMLALLAATLLMSRIVDADFLDLAFETASAIGTVGLTRNLTPSLHLLGKLLISLCMFMGRIGPITMAIAFHIKLEKKELLVYPKEDVTVG